MIKMFQIYKEGITDNWVTICTPVEQYSEALKNSKIEKYIFLGYQIKFINS